LILLAACASGHEEKPAAAPQLARAEPAPATKAAGDPDEGGQVEQQATAVATADTENNPPARGGMVASGGATGGGGVAIGGQGGGAAGPPGNAGRVGGGDLGAGVTVPRVGGDVQGRLEPGTPKVDGDLEVDEVRKIMLRGRGQLRNCYNQALKRNPSLSGLLVIHFAIGPDGKVTAAEVLRPVDDADVGRCVAARIRRFEFPKPAHGSAHVQQPFNLSPP